MNTWSIQSRFVKAEIQSLGAMVGPGWFRLGNRDVQAFAVGPWAEEAGPELEQTPRVLQRLRGEWPCVPFGMPELRPGLPKEWFPDEAASKGFADPDPHGYCSGADWELVRLESNRIELAVEYPSGYPIRRLTRTLVASDDSPALEISLRVEAREACDLPIATHPTLRLPERAGAARLDFGPDARAWTLPAPVEPGISRFEPNVRDAPLTKIPFLRPPGESRTEDVTRLPLAYPNEEVMMVLGHRGKAVLENHDEDYAATLSWDPEIFPGCGLWLSNRGRGYYPWKHRFLGVGIEPMRSAFDLGERVSRSRDNPLWRAGIPCTYRFSPGQPFETKYKIAVAEFRKPRER